MAVDTRTLPGGMTAGPGGDDLEVVFSRTFEAPRELVFKAWTEPAYLERWWGPAGFSTAGCTVDARPGGGFSLVMIAPSGLELPVAGRFEEVAPPERIRYRIGADALPEAMRPLLRNYGSQPVPPMLVTAIFTALAPRRTLLTISTRFESIEAVEGAIARGAPTGWDESLARLAALLETTP
jgi:uncharacterized protein YndB with AHSA1/START domain